MNISVYPLGTIRLGSDGQIEVLQVDKNAAHYWNRVLRNYVDGNQAEPQSWTVIYRPEHNVDEVPIWVRVVDDLGRVELDQALAWLWTPEYMTDAGRALHNWRNGVMT